MNLTPAGFTHSAFALGYEAGINKCTIDGNLFPPGALVTIVQKGLQYLEMEANLSNVSMLNSFACAHQYIHLCFFKCFALKCHRIYCDQGTSISGIH